MYYCFNILKVVLVKFVLVFNSGHY